MATQRVIDEAAHAIVDTKHPGISWTLLSEGTKDEYRAQAVAALSVFNRYPLETS